MTSRKKPAGFTLLEILIVIALIALLLGSLVPRFQKPDSGIKKVARHIMVLGRDVRNQARLKNRTFRIAFRMDGMKHGYWVESAPGLVVPRTYLQIEQDSRLREEERPKDNFQKEEKFTKEEFEMPQNIYFGQIETPALGDRMTTGTGYVYFSPEGLVEPAAIQLTDKKDLTWTLIVSPLTGHADIIQKAVLLRDVKQDQQ